MKSLELWSEYTREEIHSIFSPDTTFTPQAGTWGLHGMIRVPDRQGDWVFLVSLGNQQGWTSPNIIDIFQCPICCLIRNLNDKANPASCIFRASY